MLDAGCGEGYYLGHVRERLAAEAGLAGQPPDCTGFDVSRDAVRLAAKRYGDCFFAVADVWASLPVADASVAVLLNIFAPRNPNDFGRMVAPRGRLIVAIPGRDHLREVRQRAPLLAIQDAKRERVAHDLAPWFALEMARPMVYEMALDGEALADLVQMTPAARQVTPQAPQELAQWRQIDILLAHASFEVLLFRRLPPA